MRCNDCNKFVSYDEPQCELDSCEVGEGTVTASVTVSLNCADCGGTLKQSSIDSDDSFDHTCNPEGKPVDDWKEGDDQYELQNDGDQPEGTIRVENTDRNGKPIKNSRYMKTFYGFEFAAEIQCKKCGEIFTVEVSGEQQASGFDEC